MKELLNICWVYVDSITLINLENMSCEKYLVCSPSHGEVKKSKHRFANIFNALNEKSQHGSCICYFVVIYTYDSHFPINQAVGHSSFRPRATEE